MCNSSGCLWVISHTLKHLTSPRRFVSGSVRPWELDSQQSDSTTKVRGHLFLRNVTRWEGTPAGQWCWSKCTPVLYHVFPFKKCLESCLVAQSRLQNHALLLVNKLLDLIITSRKRIIPWARSQELSRQTVAGGDTVSHRVLCKILKHATKHLKH